MGGERVVLRSKVGAGKVSARVKEHGGAGGTAEHICWQWCRALSKLPWVISVMISACVSMHVHAQRLAMLFRLWVFWAWVLF